MSESPTKLQLCPLHSHTVYSVLDGASTISEYIQWCKDNGAPGMAVTDHGWMIGALEMYKSAGEAGIVGIPGVEFYVAPDADYKFSGKAYEYYHVTAWAVNEAGYRNLLKLGSLSFDKSEIYTQKAVTKDKVTRNVEGMYARVIKRFGQVKPRITFDELVQYNEGLVLGSGCLIGAVNKALLNGENDGAQRNLERLMSAYAGRLFVELMPHNCTHDWDRKEKVFTPNECTDFSPDGDLQKACNLKNIEIARANNLPLILTVDSHFVKPDEKPVQDMLLKNGDPDGWHFHNSYHMMTTQDAWDHWSENYGDDEENRKIFVEAVESNHQIVEMAKALTIKDEYHQPIIEIPQDLRDAAADEREALKGLIMRKIEEHGRMKWDDPDWLERLQMEMEIICDNGVQDFARYFLFMEQWQSWTRAHSILSAPGRGSGAGSLLCYLLKITHLDPFEYKLPFSRFLSPGRIKRRKFPDIDWDMGNRKPLLAKLSETYGENFAQATTHGTMKLKSALKDAFRVLYVNPLENEIDRTPRGPKRDQLVERLEALMPEVEVITKNIPNTPMGTKDREFLEGYTDKDGVEHEGYLYTDEALQAFLVKYHDEDPTKDLRTMFTKMLGIPRSVGRHASAYFISDRPIYESAPLCDVSGHTCTQYTAPPQGFSAAEKAGLIKFDILGVTTLLDISNCIRLVQKSLGYNVWKEKMKIGEKEFDLWLGERSIEEVCMPDGTVHNIYTLPEDEGVFRDLQEGKTESVFQMNSALMTGWTKRIKPTRKEDCSVIVAIIRPGPLLAEIDQDDPDRPIMVAPKVQAVDDEGRPLFHKLTMADAYVKRKNGRVPITYAHPGMEPILKDTYGVAVYQEQLQLMFQHLAGYSEEEADTIREMVGKKKKQDMENLIPELRRRLSERGWTEEQSQVFINLCLASAKYSFNRAHSASYGNIAYACAFLKHHFPKEWWTAVLQNCKEEDIREKGYARTLKDMLVLPHVNGPMDEFEARPDGKVHTPLWMVKGVGAAACKAIQKAIDDRANDIAQGGFSQETSEIMAEAQFSSLQDFFERVDRKACNEGIFEKLILVGAFSLIEPGKSEKDLFREYLYLKKLSGLKLGEGKTGRDLRDAVEAYIVTSGAKPGPKGSKCQNEQIEDELALKFSFDGLELEIKRMSLLSIYRMDVHEMFRPLMESHILYDESGIDTYRDSGGVFVSTRSTKDLALFWDSGMGKKDREVVFSGLLESKEDFEYTDKKTKEKVKALRLSIVNAGDKVEGVIWPSTRDNMRRHGEREPSGNKILICRGRVKPSRTPGLWSLSISRLVEL
jgi:DNA polymerase-3 subunit alpha